MSCYKTRELKVFQQLSRLKVLEVKGKQVCTPEESTVKGKQVCTPEESTVKGKKVNTTKESKVEGKKAITPKLFGSTKLGDVTIEMIQIYAGTQQNTQITIETNM